METVLTHEGYQELLKKLENLKSVGRKEAAEKLKVARSFGDLSENSEYDEAKSDQAKLEAEISEIEAIIANAKIMEDDNSTEVVHLGSIVTIKEATRGASELKFKITGFAQANPDEGSISDESPVGKALLGHKLGDKVTVEAPRGTTVYKITEIDIEQK
ncbi:MAG: transcription elongation factor GreA [Oscillospiraceae bacterium]|nr:transcription elongation factor GreA [Oscillospiraceae bacterium]MDD7470560.1 transcription elongation factor GreA [Oscillospiraceae bacterium]MDY2678211.1 transcription elongation factor GreA [Oscillospiraceae bacterium]